MTKFSLGGSSVEFIECESGRGAWGSASADEAFSADCWALELEAIAMVDSVVRLCVFS
jgi:hypothetical protein